MGGYRIYHLVSLLRKEGHTVIISEANLVDGGLSPPPSRVFPGVKCYMVTVTVDKKKEYHGFGPTPSIATYSGVLDAYKNFHSLSEKELTSLFSETSDDSEDGETEGDRGDMNESLIPLANKATDYSDVVAVLYEVAKCKGVRVDYHFVHSSNYRSEVTVVVFGGGMSFEGSNQDKRLAQCEAATKMLKAIVNMRDCPIPRPVEEFDDTQLSGPPFPSFPPPPPPPHPLPPHPLALPPPLPRHAPPFPGTPHHFRPPHTPFTTSHFPIPSSASPPSNHFLISNRPSPAAGPPSNDFPPSNRLSPPGPPSNDFPPSNRPLGPPSNNFPPSNRSSPPGSLSNDFPLSNRSLLGSPPSFSMRDHIIKPDFHGDGAGGNYHSNMPFSSGLREVIPVQDKPLCKDMKTTSIENPFMHFSDPFQFSVRLPRNCDPAQQQSTTAATRAKKPPWQDICSANSKDPSATATRAKKPPWQDICSATPANSKDPSAPATRAKKPVCSATPTNLPCTKMATTVTTKGRQQATGGSGRKNKRKKKYAQKRVSSGQASKPGSLLPTHFLLQPDSCKPPDLSEDTEVSPAADYHANSGYDYRAAAVSSVCVGLPTEGPPM